MAWPGESAVGMESEDQQDINVIGQSIRLPCGLRLSNRLVKAAMAPCFGKGNMPSTRHQRLYHQWSQDRFGLIITENVQVCPRHLATPLDVAIPQVAEDRVPENWLAWSRACTTPTIVQLSHAGLQSPRTCGRSLGESPVGPSSMRISLGTRLIDRLVAWSLFNQANQASTVDIDRIVDQFRLGAVFCHRAGFKGVQLHCSHGYLLSQFISSKLNRRQDEYGVTASNRLKLLFRIIDAIRASTPKSFCLALKLNCSDFSKGGLTQEEALDNIRMIVQHGVIDLIEISGGTYENYLISKEDLLYQPNIDKATLERSEAYYINFTQQAHQLVRSIASKAQKPCPVLMTTGGFRSRKAMASAISNKETDLIGLGRPACLDPSVATKILDPDLPRYCCPNTPVPGVALWKVLVPVKLIGAGFQTIWHTWQLHRMSDYQSADLSCTALGALRVILPLDAIFLTAGLLISVLLTVLLSHYFL